MKRNIFNIFAMLLTLSAAFSCSAFEEPDKDFSSETLSFVITGTVSDFTTSVPLEGIKISVSVYPAADPDGPAVEEMNVYTGNNGIYTIEAEGHDDALRCVLAVSDPEDVYEEAVQEVGITWTGVSYDGFNSRFVVNDCDFKLNKK